ncbi:MAG: kinesin light chain [Lasallia pustulata]|uniref:Kinesin light chain n=1 Tax=Lasallia pustulata TaxID=136370 RepID=A0A5M8PGW9_9LECA|nr:MAG: kinesin light chain [Lasallia pustulata]
MKEVHSVKTGGQRPGIHYGLIASGDTVMESGKQRDRIAVLIKGHWLVPFRQNEQFVGRDSHLEEIITKLHPQNHEDACQRLTVDGLGGVGKTQIALEAAFRLQKEHPYHSVFWVPAIDVTNFERAFREIGQKLQIAGINDDKADVKLLVKMALSQEIAGSWLLIVDNPDNIDMLYNRGNKVSESGESLTLADYLPFSRKGSILFTTRNHKVAVKHAGVNVIEVKEMTENDSLQLLQASLIDPSLSGEEAMTTKLLHLLTHLLLAIKQAAAFMNKNMAPVSEYLGIYESNPEELLELLSIDFEDQGRYQATQNPIVTTWLISFHQILDCDPLAASYLYFMSYIAQQDVPHSLLPQNTRIKKTQAIGTLQAYAFITPRQGQHSYYLHRLVRIVVQNWLKVQGDLHEETGKTLKHITNVFPFPVHENRDMWTLYLPHALYILNYRSYSTGDEKSQRDLLSDVGECFKLTGKYIEAEQMLQQALKLKEKALGKEHPDTLQIMNNLAVTLSIQCCYKEAGKMYLQALQLQEKVLGKEHLDSVPKPPPQRQGPNGGCRRGGEQIHRKSSLNLQP